VPDTVLVPAFQVSPEEASTLLPKLERVMEVICAFRAAEHKITVASDTDVFFMVYWLLIC
jgi:hypothetical protein